MHFCPIPPKEMLHQVLTERKAWFALAQEPYEFSQAVRQPDTFVILDNGAYEGCLTVTNYVTEINCWRPNVVVLPDLLLGPWKRSMHLGLGFLEQVDFPSVEWMYVPQAEAGDKDGWTQSLMWAANDERVSWIGLPRCMCTDIFKYPLARIFWAEYIRDKYPHLKVHALGMVNGNVHELPFLAQAGVVSIDSSCPFNAANINNWKSKLEEIDNACLT